MNVAGVQFRRGQASVDAALDLLRGLASEAASGADLVVLPEMAATGYVYPSLQAVREVAEEAGGRTFEALAPVAKAHGCWLVAGFPEIEADRVYNSAYVLDPGGGCAFVYRKTLLYDADLPWASVGDHGYRTFDTDGGSFTVGICMDLNDDRFLQHCARSGVRAVAFPANWVEEGYDVWRYWASRLGEVPAALVAANTWGVEGPIAFSGLSGVLDQGIVRAKLGFTGNGVFRANLS